MLLTEKGKRPKENHFTTGETRQVRDLAGQLNWTSSQRRPDVSFSVCETSTSIKGATISDLIHANKSIRRLKAEQIVRKPFPIHCLTDNKSLLESIHCANTLKETRLKVDVCIIREMLEKNEIRSINWCASEKQLAD